MIGTFIALNYVRGDIRKNHKQKPLILSNIFSILIVFIITVLIYYYIVKVYGTITSFFTQRYGIFEADGINSITSFLPFFLCGLVLTFNSGYVAFPRFGKYFILVASIAACGVFLLGGNRNIAVVANFFVQNTPSENSMLLC